MKIENAMLICSILHVVFFVASAIIAYDLGLDGWLIFIYMNIGTGCSLTYFDLRKKR